MSKRILFVCLGNICRSPLAEGIMLHLKNEQNLDLTIDSAGTADYHVGQPPDYRTIANALKHGVDLNFLRARSFEPDDFKKFDFIFAMDKNNLNKVLKTAQNKHDKAKVKLFLEWVGGAVGQEVPDPYYGTEEDFEQVFNLIYDACVKLCGKIE